MAKSRTIQLLPAHLHAGCSRSRRLAYLALALLIALFLCAAQVRVRADGPEARHALEFVEDGALSLVLEPGKRAVQAAVAVRNSGPALTGIRFSVVSAAGTVDVSAAQSTMDAFTVQQFDLVFVVEDPAESTSGHLVVQTGGSVVPGVRSLNLAPAAAPSPDGDLLMLGSLGFAALFVLLRAFTIVLRVDCGLGDRMGPAAWSFSSSWASTLTAVGALLGTILSAGVLPEETGRLSNAGFAGLNLLFGTLIVLAGFVYSATRRPTKATDPEEGVQYQGFVWSFLLASAITLWAVLGELATMSLLVLEMRSAGSMSALAVAVFQVLLAIAGLLTLGYAWRTIYWTVERQHAYLEAARNRLFLKMMTSQDFEAQPEITPREKLQPELPGWSML